MIDVYLTYLRDVRRVSPNTVESYARDLADAGVTPGDARMKTAAGAGDYTDTVGFKVSTGDLEVEEARDLLRQT